MDLKLFHSNALTSVDLQIAVFTKTQLTDAIYKYMRKAIGFALVLYVVSHMMSEPFTAFMHATSATMETVEVAANLSQQQLIELAQ